MFCMVRLIVYPVIYAGILISVQHHNLSNNFFYALTQQLALKDMTTFVPVPEYGVCLDEFGEFCTTSYSTWQGVWILYAFYTLLDKLRELGILLLVFMFIFNLFM